jgi:hypothetical protein
MTETFDSMTFDEIEALAAKITTFLADGSDPEVAHGEADKFCEAALLYVIEDRAGQRAVVELAYGVMRCPGPRWYA